MLAFDSTGPCVTVGLARDGAALGRWDEATRKTQGNVLDRLIDRALAELGWSRHDIEGLALVTGPGSLTATRLGWATAAGWGQSADIPITGWPTPVVHHRQWRESRNSEPGGTRTSFCLVHHRGDSFYCYRFLRHELPGPPIAITLGQWSPGERPAKIIGPGIIGYRERWRHALPSDVELADDQECIVGGDLLAAWGEADLAAGRRLPLDSSPLDYGLPPDFRRVNDL
ncbi:MAG: hypothetical protein AB1792_11590 [Candidatus Zixiibacteriota bacterium]